MKEQIKLNLGCGQNLLPDYVNVDKFGEPNIRHDLEKFPWPWHDNSVKEIVLNHCLEHLGATTSVYLKIFQEMYRICISGARIHIVVPHPRHDDFVSDPTHVRIVTPNGLRLFSKKLNRKKARKECSNSPLGIFLDVDFELVAYKFTLDADWQKKVDEGLCSESDLFQAIKKYNNVVKEIQMALRVVK